MVLRMPSPSAKPNPGHVVRYVRSAARLQKGRGDHDERPGSIAGTGTAAISIPGAEMPETVNGRADALTNASRWRRKLIQPMQPATIF